MNIYFVKNIRVYIFIYRNSIRIRTLQVHINGILDILCVRIIVRLNDIQHSNNRLSLSQTKGRKEEDTCDERWKCPRNTYFFFFFFIFFPFCLIFNRAKWTCQNPLPIRAGGKWEGDESGWWLSNTRGGACNSEAAPYFNIVPSYIMFQQNGRRTRGSSAPSTGRVVYLEYTIPPRATLTLSLSFSLSPFLPLSLSLSSSNAAQSGRVERKGMKSERERKIGKGVKERKKERERLWMEGGSRGYGWEREREGGGRRRPSATNAHH